MQTGNTRFRWSWAAGMQPSRYGQRLDDRTAALSVNSTNPMMPKKMGIAAGAANMSGGAEGGIDGGSRGGSEGDGGIGRGNLGGDADGGERGGVAGGRESMHGSVTMPTLITIGPTMSIPSALPKVSSAARLLNMLAVEFNLIGSSSRNRMLRRMDAGSTFRRSSQPEQWPIDI